MAKMTATCRITFDVLFDDNGEDDHVAQAIAEIKELDPEALIAKAHVEVIHIQRPEEPKDV